jgi:ferredoxin--NADP+ reductase
MYQIIKKVDLAPSIKLMKITAPEVAKKARAGQFIILRMHDRAERIPLTVADYNREEGTITIVFQEVGKATEELGTLKEGECLLNFVGPLGLPSEIEQFGNVICVGGGVGIAPIHPIARSLKEAGNKVTSIIGARNAGLLFFEEEMKKVSDQLQIVTDDGTRGRKGFVTDALRDLLNAGEKVDFVFAVGPVPMMYAVSELTKKYQIKTMVSLNPIMVDGTGMCGACRVAVGGKTKFACVDGPDFDAQQVDFDLLLKRQKMFCREEKTAVEHWHTCKCRGEKK